MDILEKISQRVTDPVFYRKRARLLARRGRRFDDRPRFDDWRELGEFRRVVAVVAHPDDETFCSGLLADLVESGADATVLCLTRGEGGPTGGLRREDLGAVREEEMRRACSVLGIESVQFLGHVDPLARSHRVYAPAVSPADLAAQIREHLAGADLLLSHGSCGEYWHPAHLLVHDTVRRIRNGRRFRGEWLTFLARQPDHPLPRLVNWDDPVTLSIDCSNRCQVREEALRCHASQLDLFRRFGGGTVSDFIRMTAVETYARW